MIIIICLKIKVEYTEYKSWYSVVYNNVMCNKTIIFQPIKTNMYAPISTFDKIKINFAINSMIVFKTYFSVLLLLFILKIAIPENCISKSSLIYLNIFISPFFRIKYYQSPCNLFSLGKTYSVSGRRWSFHDLHFY